MLSFVLTSCWNNNQIRNEDDINQIKSDAEKWSEENAQNTTKHSREDCMKWCEMLWKWNVGNKDKTVEDMNKNCNGLCDFQQWIENNDISYCEKTEWTYKSMCYSTIAKNTKDASLCEKNTNKIFTDTCYTTVAEAKKDISICDKITEQMSKDTCIETVKK